MKEPSIWIVGARGIGNYGGFETFIKEFGPRLADRGYRVTVGSEDVVDRIETYQGVHVEYFPFKLPKNYSVRKLFEVFYDYYFILLATYRGADVIYILGCTANLFTGFPRLFGVKTMTNIAGLEWLRSKFSPLEKIMLKILTKLSMIGSEIVVLDNSQLRLFVDGDKFKKKIVTIAYGVSEFPYPEWNRTILKKYQLQGVEKDGYWLVVARLQPDNNIHEVIEEYLLSVSEKPLIIVGGPACNDSYIRKLKKLTDGTNVRLIGGVYDLNELNMLRQNTYGYIHPHSIGGTNPSLLEAMVCGNIILADSNPFNREVCQDTALFYSNEDPLSSVIKRVENEREKFIELKERAKTRVLDVYSWNKIVDNYETILTSGK